MKEYLIDKDMKHCYILRYEIIYKNNSIKVFYANGNIDYIPYNKRNEEIILNKMKKQLQSYNEDKIAEKIVKNFFQLIGSVFEILFAITLLNNSIRLAIMLIVMSSIIFTKKIINIIKFSSIEKDYEKNILFLKNKEKLNENLQKNNVLKNLNKKDKKIVTDAIDIAKKHNKKDILDLNSIDKLKLKYLRQILINIEKEQYFDYSSTQSQEPTLEPENTHISRISLKK